MTAQILFNIYASLCLPLKGGRRAGRDGGIERDRAERFMCEFLCLAYLACEKGFEEGVSLQHTQHNALQHTAKQCNTLQNNATHCNTLQYNATQSNTLQHTAAHCNTLQQWLVLRLRGVCFIVYVFVCLSVYPSVCLSICLSVCLSV